MAILIPNDRFDDPASLERLAPPAGGLIILLETANLERFGRSVRSPLVEERLYA